MQTRIPTPRLLLRPPRPSDAPQVFARWSADIEVLRYLGQRPHADVAKTRAQLMWDEARWLKRSAWTWLLMEDGRDDSPVGLVTLTSQNPGGPPHHLRLGYVLARSHWGRGLMNEALDAVMDQLWPEEAACWRVDAVCDVDNPASARVLERIGFEREGMLRRHTLHPNAGDTPRDVWLYARVREERQELNTAGRF